jgi:hypothetical protein
MYFDTILGGSQQTALSDEYTTGNTDPKKIGAFARNLGAITVVPVTHPGTDSYTFRDYTLKHIEKLIALNDIDATRLIWQTLISHESRGICFFHKESRTDGRYNFSSIGDSSIIETLKQYAWVPQKYDETIEFVRPRDAAAEKLPEGFTYATELQWLKVIEFGKDVQQRREAQRREKESQTVAYRRKEEAARECGFETAEEADEMAKLRKERPDEIKKLIAKGTSPRNERPTFPSKSVANPEQRTERLREQLAEAPDKSYEKRERSVRTSSSAIDAGTWLRNQYTNDGDQMLCQICQEVMPFRKRDGQWYFESVELFEKGDPAAPSQELEAQHLALCPLCAAKYKEFVKNDSETTARLRLAIIGTENSTVPLRLGAEEAEIRFVETHLHDLRCTLDARRAEV